MLKFTLKHINPFALFWMVALLGWGCRQDVVDIRPYPNTSAELSLFLKQVPDAATTTTFQFNGIHEDKILTTPNGLRVFLTDVDQLFSTTTAPTSVVECSTCSELKFVVTVAMTKGDILARELPTSSDEDVLLESGGMVQLQVFCGNTELQLLPGRKIKIQLPAVDAKDNMFVHSVVRDNQIFKGWKNTGQEVFKADWPAPGGNGTLKGYELNISELGWSNCARPLSQVDMTSFCVSLEPNYTGLNTQAYLIFQNTLVIAPLKFDDASHSFCFPNVPPGYPVRVISIAKLDSSYWLGSTTTETGTNSMLPLQPQKLEAQEVLGYLRGL